MPSAPKSFTTTAHVSFAGFALASARRMCVVFPAPSAPVMTFTGVRAMRRRVSTARASLAHFSARMRVAAAAAADARAACVSTMCPRIDDALRGGVQRAPRDGDRGREREREDDAVRAARGARDRARRRGGVRAHRRAGADGADATDRDVGAVRRGSVRRGRSTRRRRRWSACTWSRRWATRTRCERR